MTHNNNHTRPMISPLYYAHMQLSTKRNVPDKVNTHAHTSHFYTEVVPCHMLLNRITVALGLL